MILRDKIYINTAELGYKISSLCELFTYKNPEIFHKKRLKLSIRNVPPYLYHYKLADTDGKKILQIPRGGLPRVIAFYKQNNLPFRLIDQRIERLPIDVHLIDTTLDKQQERVVNVLLQNDGGLIEVSPGGGKCLGYGTKIIMYDGSIKEVQDIVSGDTLMGDDSTPRTVLTTTKGKGLLYSIKQNRGINFVCNDAHILTLKNSNKIPNDPDGGTIIDISISDYLNTPARVKDHLKCFKVPINFNEKEILIDPYWLGLWLGDGNKRNTSIDNPEPEIINYCTNYAEKLNLKFSCVKDPREKCYRSSISQKDVNTGNILLTSLRHYNLIMNKHIPKEYKTNSKEVRLQLLAGLLDTDGYSAKDKSGIELTLKDSPLVYDVVFLIRSLGFYCSLNTKIPPKGYESNSYKRLNIYGNLTEIPMRVKRKLPKKRKINKDHLVTGFSIEALGEGDYYGFTLDGNGRFLLEDCTVTHNTISMLGLISILKQPTLIITHEHRLSAQWMTEIRSRLGGTYTLGKYDGDIKEDGDIVVGIINSLYNLYQENPGFFDKFGTIIVDETHHLPAEMFLSVLNNMPAKYRIGVTGTVKRKDQKELLTFDVLGKILIKFDAGDLKHRITTFDYRIVNTNIRMEIPTIFRWTGQKREDVLNMTELLTKLVENNDRNAIILKEAIDLIQTGYFPLILSDRVQHNEYLHEQLNTLGIKTVLMIGKTRKKTNWDVIRNDQTIQCIVANSKIASEGLDLPRLSALLLTCPSTNVHKLKQQIGRIRRVCEGKPLPMVIDFCDNLACTRSEDDPNYLLRHTARTRIRFYEKLKNEYDDVEDTDS